MKKHKLIKANLWKFKLLKLKEIFNLFSRIMSKY